MSPQRSSRAFDLLALPTKVTKCSSAECFRPRTPESRRDARHVFLAFMKWTRCLTREDAGGGRRSL